MKEHCFGSFDIHATKLEQTRIQLTEWHKNQCEKLKIDIEDCKRKNTGLLALLEKPISLINNDWNYKAVDKETIGLIKEQTFDLDEIRYSTDNPFEDEVEIIVMNGKKFYLPLTK